MRSSGRLPLEALQPYLLATDWGPRVQEQPPRPLVWAAVFGNPQPVEIEVGSGKGLFLLNASRERPQVNFLGIEIEKKYALFTATRLAKRGAAHVKMACCDGRWFLRSHVADGSVQALHVYFPDPWWKNKHRKRRLFTHEFAVQAARVLQPGGRLHFVTDVAEYFTETMEMLRGLATLQEISQTPQAEARHDMDYLTNFERKYRRAGRPIHRALLEKS